MFSGTVTLPEWAWICLTVLGGFSGYLVMLICYIVRLAVHSNKGRNVTGRNDTGRTGGGDVINLDNVSDGSFYSDIES
jgi:hypothetical protein